MITSPYAGKPESTWLSITEQLVNKHRLSLDVLRDACLKTWGTLWQTTVGAGPLAIKLMDLHVPATVVGYFFEVLLARELSQRDPLWGGHQSKDDKDLVYEADPYYSVEVKTSGQAGFKVYGNRSASQPTRTGRVHKQEKSGFYLTVNFYRQTLTLIRFGWIDHDTDPETNDWKPQKTESGQMSGLKQRVYDYKLVRIPGPYRQLAPVLLLDGVGHSTADQLAQLGITTIGDLLRYQDQLPGRLSRLKQKNQKFLDECTGSPPH